MKQVFETEFPLEEASFKNGFEGYDSEDSGVVLTSRLESDGPLYVDIISTTEMGGNHEAFLALRGKRIRVTIETLEEKSTWLADTGWKPVTEGTHD